MSCTTGHYESDSPAGKAWQNSTAVTLEGSWHDNIPVIHSRRTGRAWDTQQARQVASYSRSRVHYAHLPE